MRKSIFLNILLIIVFLTLSPSIWARSGCCSHHEGVCGCSCCDGTPLSSTCAPYYPECSRTDPEPTYSLPTSTPFIPPPTFTTVPPTNTPIPTATPTLTLSPTPDGVVLSAEDISPSQPQKSGTATDTNPVGTLLSLGVMGGIGYWFFKGRHKNG